MSEEKPTQEIITLHSGGPIAGIPGGHVGPGTYVVDWVARTITPLAPVVDVQIQPPPESEEKADEHSDPQA